MAAGTGGTQPFLSASRAVVGANTNGDDSHESAVVLCDIVPRGAGLVVLLNGKRSSGTYFEAQ